jgi:hypothetical protein
VYIHWQTIAIGGNCPLTIEFSGGTPAVQRIAAEMDARGTEGRVHFIDTPPAATICYTAHR